MVTSLGSMTREVLTFRPLQSCRSCLLLFYSTTSHLQNSCRPPWYYITVPSQSDCQWTATDAQICLWLYWKVLLLYSDSSTDRAVTKLTVGEICIETGDKAVMSANITARYSATGIYPTTPRLFPTQPLLPVLYHTVRTLRSATLWQRLRRQLLLFFHSKSLGRLFLCLEHLATLCQPSGMMIRWRTVQKSVVT